MSQTKERNGSEPLAVERLPDTIANDIHRVITRFFDAGAGEKRIRTVVNRVKKLGSERTARLLEQVFQRFRTRHKNIKSIFEENYRTAISMIGESDVVEEDQQLLIGSYFTMEYAIESAALFNPSIVEAPNQDGLPKSAVRVIMSLRATGEGHVSSIVFRTGVIYSHPEARFQMNEPSSQFTNPIRVFPDRKYLKSIFHRKLKDIDVRETEVDSVLARLGKSFTMDKLKHAITEAQEAGPNGLQSEEAYQNILWLARSNYQLEISGEADPSEMVIFPQNIKEIRGMEDLRMVRFVDQDNNDKVTYYGTFTAFDGYRALPQFIETTDFLNIGVHTLNGKRAQDKGMALFPRRIDGHYVMCSRNDGENLYIMKSDIVHFWEDAKLLRKPEHDWEFMQIGNCGSPLETDKGWLLLTHGVGPMRTYFIGAMLLDLNNPLKVIGTLDEPLIMPKEEERDGYVPNVVYTCGAMIHKQLLYVPFSTSDTVTRIATIELAPLLDRLVG